MPCHTLSMDGSRAGTGQLAAEAPLPPPTDTSARAERGDNTGGESVVAGDRRLPDDPVRFLQDCVRRGRVLWTYHVNIRLAGRAIRREAVLASVDTYELVEAYPGDKYLPSYLLLARHGSEVLHVLFAADIEGGNVRVVTAYHPDLREWQPDMRTRRRQP
jgi:hypothetical protein